MEECIHLPFVWSYSSGRAIPNEDNVVFSSGSGKTAWPHAVTWHSKTSKKSKLFLGRHFLNSWIIDYTVITFVFRFYSIIYHFVVGIKIYFYSFWFFFLFRTVLPCVAEIWLFVWYALIPRGVYPSLVWFAMQSFTARSHSKKLVVAFQCNSVGDVAVPLALLCCGNSPYEWYWQILQRISFFSDV